ncbi:TetR family transcriptional regulator [Saccharopolyspora sp. K220]|uniref:TetR/AcrR family transcriptional regulator n=1 Tax=Saccharopolyspora soli TaxID=2926618 RepID=UPI001F599805|nr:TetR family transcriptional regulator [Saccharopolyspora soli]MCI2420879.1 TetR family transcriptional regulator [Saccharopolyspora soli]
MATQDWRERKKAETRHRIQEHALRLFLGKGYESTTVEQIAVAAGVSHMTFFRHFRTKEDVVLRDEYDPMLESLIRDRPRSEHPVTRIHAAVRDGLARIYAADREALLVRTRLVLETPALRARLLENQVATRELLERALDGATPSFETRVLASVCLAALTTALEVWVRGGGEAELPELIDDAFRVLDELVG